METIACDVALTTSWGEFGNIVEMSYETLAAIATIAMDDEDPRAEVTDCYDVLRAAITLDSGITFRFYRDEFAHALESQGVEWEGHF